MHATHKAPEKAKEQGAESLNEENGNQIEIENEQNGNQIEMKNEVNGNQIEMKNEVNGNQIEIEKEDGKNEDGSQIEIDNEMCEQHLVAKLGHEQPSDEDVFLEEHLA